MKKDKLYLYIFMTIFFTKIYLILSKQILQRSLSEDEEAEKIINIIQNSLYFPNISEYTKKNYTYVNEQIVLSINNYSLYTDKNNINEYIVSIDLGACGELLKDNNNISNLIISQISYLNNSNFVIKIYSELGNSLDFSICSKEVITEYRLIPSDNISLIYYDSNHEMFNDICYTDKNSAIDIPIKTRRKQLYKNYTYCQEGCNYLGIDYNERLFKCSCPGSVYEDSEIIYGKIYPEFSGKKENTNYFRILLCFRTIFNKNKLKLLFSNYTNYIFLVCLLVNIINFIVFIYKKNKMFYYFIFPKESSKNNNKQKNTNNLQNQKNKKIVDILNSPSSVDKLDSNSIRVYPYSSTDNISNSKININNDNQIDSKIFKKVFIYKLQTYCPLIKIIIKPKTEIINILISYLLLELINSFFLNSLLYSEMFLEYYYENNKKYNFKFNFTKIFYSFAFLIILKICLSLLKLDFDFDDSMLFNKRNILYFKELNRKKYIDNLKIKIFIFYILLFCINLFIWIYCSTFIILYTNNQNILAIDSIITLVFCFIGSIIISLLATIFVICLKC